MRRPFLAIVVAISLAFIPLGCRPNQTIREASAPTSRVEHFKQRQAATQLTHGRIRIDTVEEGQDGRIKYQTTDGKTWLVAMTPDSRGGYRYGTPEEAR
jgi:hypothetical protein